MTAPVLEMRGISKRFPGVVALDDVDLSLQAGEVHVLLGENGAGKSTLIKILSGAYHRDAGEILLHGRAVDIRQPSDARSLGLRVIYQELSLVPHLSVAENIFLGALPTRWGGVIDWRTLYARAGRLLTDLGLAVSPHTSVHRLSLAERQVVEIAKGLAAHASVLVMDEPTSALTATEVDQLFVLVDRLVARGVAIVYITHRLDEVRRIGHRVTVLRDGRRVATSRLADVTPADLVRHMANRDVETDRPRLPTLPGDELLRVEGLSRTGALTDVSFCLRAGEIVGLGGGLGAGRTQLARLLAGVDRADGGRLFVRGREAQFRSPAEAIALGIGLLPEDRKAQGFVGGFTMTRNISLPHGRRLAPHGVLQPGREAALADPIVGQLRIAGTSTQAVRLLSGGNQQKVVLGKWLAGDARIFVFDEPTRGVDVGAKAEIYALMNRLTAAGAGIIMISSELPELLGMSDRILVMRQGRVQAEFSAATATEVRVLSAALGLAS
jgi:ribose transport system ATP-binding protein